MADGIERTELTREKSCDGSKNYFNADRRKKVYSLFVRAVPMELW